MNTSQRAGLLLAALFALTTAALSQSSSTFDLETYRGFLATHANMGTEQLIGMHPTGLFHSEAKAGM